MRDHFGARHFLFSRFLSIVIVCLAAATPTFAHMGFHEEIEELTSRMEADPDNAELYLRRGDLYREHGEWDMARTDLDRARRIEPSLSMFDLYEGKFLLDLGEFVKARQALNAFLKREPHNIEGFVTRARIWEALGKNLDAAADYNSAILEFKEPNKPLPEHYIHRSRALTAAGNQYLGAALQGLEEGMAVLGPIITLELYALELEMQAGRYHDALARVDRIAAGANRKESWLIRRGEILEQMGRNTEALEAYEAANRAIESLPRRLRETRAVMNLKDQSEKARKDLGQGKRQ